MERVGKQKREMEPEIRSMDTPKKSYGRHKNSFWKPGEGADQHFDLRHRLLETYRKKYPCRWENQSRGDHKQRCSTQLKNPYVPPKKSDMGRAQLHRERATPSTRYRKNKNQQDLRFKLLKIRTEKCSQPDITATYFHRTKPRKPDLKAPASGWARNAVTSLRALILSKIAHRNSKAGGAVSAKKFKNGYHAEHKKYPCRWENQPRGDHKQRCSTHLKNPYVPPKKSDMGKAQLHRKWATPSEKFKNEYDAEHKKKTSEAIFQKRNRRFKSDYSFKENRIVSGNSVTLILSRKGDTNNDDTLKGAERVDVQRTVCST